MMVMVMFDSEYGVGVKFLVEVLLRDGFEEEAVGPISMVCYHNSSGSIDLGRLRENFLAGSGHCSSSESMICFVNQYISSIVASKSKLSRFWVLF